MTGFDLLAPYYDRLVKIIFGDRLHDATAEHLDFLKPDDKVLILGGGTGRILTSLPPLQKPVLYIDTSAQMISQAKKRKTQCEVVFSAEEKYFHERIDAIILPFFLDMFDISTGKAYLNTIQKNLADSGKILFTDFATPQRQYHKLLLWLMYRFFRVLCGIEAKALPNYDLIFQKDLKIVYRKKYMDGFLETRLYEKVI